MPQRQFSYGPGLIDVWMAAGSVVACATPFELPDVRFAACLQPVLGVVQGSGQDFSTNRTQTQPWLAMAAGISATGTIAGPFEWTARAEPLVVLERQSFAVDHLGIGYSSSIGGFVVGVGARAAIW